MNRRKEGAKREVQYWNDAYPVGTPVRYWPGLREGEGTESTTRSSAWILGEDAVVMVVGKSGGIALSHVEVVKA